MFAVQFNTSKLLPVVRFGTVLHSEQYKVVIRAETASDALRQARYLMSDQVVSIKRIAP
jgi:hypothetical protein